MNIPNLITVLRVLLIPIFILLFYLPYHWSYLASASVFALPPRPTGSTGIWPVVWNKAHRSGPSSILLQTS
jgi:hypothetical protein